MKRGPRSPFDAGPRLYAQAPAMVHKCQILHVIIIQYETASEIPSTNSGVVILKRATLTLTQGYLPKNVFKSCTF